MFLDMKNIGATKYRKRMSVQLMKYTLMLILFLLCKTGKAQQVDSLFFNLYTDSLKKGSWNYINVDAKLSNGKFMPLTSKQLVITTTGGKLEGNSIWIDWNFNVEKITVEVYLKERPHIKQQKTIWVKKYDLELNTPAGDSLLQQLNQRNRKSTNGKRKKN